MKLSTTVAGLSISLSLSAAFHVPESITDGVYSVHTHPNGTEEHKRIGDPVSPSTTRSRSTSRIQKRFAGDFSGAPQCYPGEALSSIIDEQYPALNPDATDAATAGIQNQCGAGADISSGLDFYSISGCTVAYACNFLEGGLAYTKCFADASARANGIITLGEDGDSGCGSYFPGSILDNYYQVAYGYENYCSSRGSNFCGRGA